MKQNCRIRLAKNIKTFKNLERQFGQLCENFFAVLRHQTLATQAESELKLTQSRGFIDRVDESYLTSEIAKRKTLALNHLRIVNFLTKMPHMRRTRAMAFVSDMATDYGIYL